MTLLEFLILTREWLTAKYETGQLDDAIKKMKGVIKLTEEKSRQWWAWAKYLTICITITAFIIFLGGVIMGGLTKADWPNSVAGLLIAPPLFILLVWWTPLIAIIAVVSELANLKIRNVPDAIVAQAKWWLGLTGGILLWQVIASLTLTFVPYWNALSRLPVLMLLALALALIGVRWGSFPNYRKIIKTAVVVTFITQIAVCFFPHTATALQGWAGKADKNAAKSIETNGLLPKTLTKKVSVPPRNVGWTKWLAIQTATNSMIRVYNGDEFIYKSPASFWVVEDGGNSYIHNQCLPEEERTFKFNNLPDEGREIKILPVGSNAFWLDFRIAGR